MITSFRNENYFLSNMFPTKVTVPWGTYECAEAAFQAAKCVDETQKTMFINIDGFTAKKLGGIYGYNGHKIVLRPDWNDISYDIMRQVVTAKFSNDILAQKLLATGEEELVEGSKNDRLWGAVWNGTAWEGENRLGKILAATRQNIRNGKKETFKPAEEEDPVEKTWRWVFSQASVTLSDEQKSVIRQITEDFKGTKVTRLLVGNAGVGKTTVLYVLTVALSTFCGAVANKNMAICAPTNKAARVLIEKGLKSARTIHDVFLSPTQKGNTVTFGARNTLREPYKFVVVDEASMVDDKILDDLDAYQKDFGTNFLFVGDNFQLPPVKSSVNDAFSRYSKNVYALTKVFRQAKGSEILDYATALRTIKTPFVPATTKGQVEIMDGKEVVNEYFAALKDGKSAVAIVYRNDTRNRVNAITRAALGYQDPVVEGEHVICVANVDNSFQNGEEFELHDIKKVEPITVTVNGRNQNGFYVEDRHGKHLLLPESDSAAVYHQQVQGIKGIDTKYLLYPNQYTKKPQLAQNVHVIYYGYAITAHKSQGSQWDEIFLLEIADRDNATRWLYTAVTRAAKRLVIFNSYVSRTWAQINAAIGVTVTEREEETTTKNKNTIVNKKADVMKESVTVTDKVSKNEKEETNMENKNIGIIVVPETLRNMVATYGTSIVATYKNNLGIETTPNSLMATMDIIKAEKVKISDTVTIDHGQKTLTFGDYKLLELWYARRVKDIDIAGMLGGKQLITCSSFQAAGLKANLEAAGYTVQFNKDEKTGIEYDGVTYFKERYDAFTREINANAFKVAKNYTVIGAGEYILRDGTTVKEYCEGQYMSRILLPNENVKFNFDASFFETRGAIVIKGDVIVAFVYLLVMADAEDEAIRLVNVWANHKWGDNAHLYIGKEKMPVAYLKGGPCCWKLRTDDKNERTAKNASTVLKEAHRISRGNYLYAGVQEKAPVKTQAQTPEIETADIETIKLIVKDLVAVAVKPLNAEIEALKKENVELKADIAALNFKLSTMPFVAPVELNASVAEEQSTDIMSNTSEESTNPPAEVKPEDENLGNANNNGDNPPSTNPFENIISGMDAALNGTSEQPATNDETETVLATSETEQNEEPDNPAEEIIPGFDPNKLFGIDAFKKLGEIVEEKSETVENPDDNHKAQEDDKKSEQDDNDKDPEDPEDPPTTNPAPTPAEKEPFSAITGMFAELETTAGNSSKSEETTKPLTQNPPSKEAEEQSSQTDPVPETEVSPSANFHKPEDNNIPTGQVKVRRKKTKKVNPNQGSLFDFSDQPVPKTENHPATNNNEDSAMTGFDSNDTKPVSTLPETEENGKTKEKSSQVDPVSKTEGSQEPTTSDTSGECTHNCATCGNHCSNAQEANEDKNVDPVQRAHKSFKYVTDTLLVRRGKAHVGITEGYDPHFNDSWFLLDDFADFSIIVSKGLPTKKGQERMLANPQRYIFHAGMTGMGGSVNEPNVKPWKEQLAAVEDFVQRGFPRDHVVIRIDPIMPHKWGIELAKEVATAAFEKGFKVFRYSFTDAYAYVKKRYAGKSASNLLASSWIEEQKEQAKKAMHIWFDFCATMEAKGCQFFTCAEGWIAPKHHVVGCVSGRDFDLCGIPRSRMFGTTSKQRSSCECDGSKFELMPHLKVRCPHKCTYCFWHANPNWDFKKLNKVLEDFVATLPTIWKTTQLTADQKPSVKESPVLTEIVAPAVTPTLPVTTSAPSAADIKVIKKFLSVEEPSKFGYFDIADYNADIKAYNESLQAAANAAAIFGVSLKEMDKMTVDLLDGVNDSCTFSDIKVENGEVFVTISDTGEWQKLAVITKGTKKVFSLK